MSEQLTFDVLIIGSGAAGLTLALSLPSHLQVAVISKDQLDSGSTRWAQGGVAGVLDATDSVDAHVSDTLIAGAGLCNESAVRFTVENSASAIQWLIDTGVPFTLDGIAEQGGDQRFHLTREGGHSARRIIHAADATGLAISDTLIDRAKEQPNLHLLHQYIAVDLITRDKLGLDGQACIGAYFLDKDNRKVAAITARATVLATGGASKVYLYTTNPDTASGDGIAMAWRAGCRIANMEFNQFHPTCLHHPLATSFLISEAVRGEGGKLLLPDGSRFMDRFDARGELAPRDIVARAIDHEMKRLGANCLYLDISHKPADFIRHHFPTILERCLELGIDIQREPIPIVPASHYTCGGVVTDHFGRTDIDGLYAIGETACTGLHGANRLASNSLLECLVYARSAATHIIDSLNSVPDIPDVPAWDASLVTDSDEDVVIAHNWDELRRFMWDYVGIVRTTKRLLRAKHRVQLLRQEIQEFYSHHRVTADLLELRNLVDVAEIIIRSALLRRESRGLHYSRDYPNPLPRAFDTVITAKHLRELGEL
ncbi:L-aspartate oxidase [Candidatus Thalassolituus haligoni]|uniref:L-aspartate oxidase n=1 Tax=Candidatus Thalassolituus haligoni TaxID=3100113 RepID=UPI003519B3F4|tara:strand:- start:21372 stop:22997 length:1626 start_codon:yes stop_codon:yes gene_type:complete